MILNRKKSYKIDVRCELYQTRTILQSYDEGQLTIQVHGVASHSKKRARSRTCLRLPAMSLVTSDGKLNCRSSHVGYNLDLSAVYSHYSLVFAS